MAPPILSLRDINLTLGSDLLLKDVEFFISQNDRICLVGRNGSGKSTLLKIVAGKVEPDSGDKFVQPGITIEYLPQEPDLSGFRDVYSYTVEKQNTAIAKHTASYLLQQFGIKEDRQLDNLSGGETRKAALAKVLAPKPDILLLDEPTNHLDVETIEWLENELQSLKCAIILISHDRRFLENLSESTVWLKGGEAFRLNNNFKKFEAWRDKILEQEAIDHHKLKQKIVREEHWLTYGVTARRKRNIRRLKELQELRKIRQTTEVKVNKIKADTSITEPSGKIVFDIENISKSYGEISLVRDFSMRITRGDRIGFIGKNGAGKTTFLNLLIGEISPEKGTIKLGTKLDIVSLDQRRESLDPKISLSDTLTEGGGDMVFVGGKSRHVVSYLKDFLFKPEQAGTPVSALSGGERGRLMLARAFAKPSNLLVLDEPTNDLDHETLDFLQELISEYKGTLLLVSHDRDFLDKVVTSVIAPDEAKTGSWIEYVGGYSDMLNQKKINKEPSKTNIEKIQNRIQKKSNKKPERITYNDRYALENLPKKIEELNLKIKKIESRLANQNYFVSDPEGFKNAALELEKLTKEKVLSEEEWLKLELRREEVEGIKKDN